MEEKDYSQKDFIESMKHDQHLLNEDADNFNSFFNNHIATVEYESSNKKRKRAIICSYKPMIEFYLKGIGFKDADIRIIFNKMNIRKNEIVGDTKHIITYCFLMKEVRKIPLTNIKILSNIRICEDNIEKIIHKCKEISKAWKNNRTLLERFAV